ncbi:thermonuclease family protein [Afifella sp. IM 167]|uniref:thermonuclease family protein n=1 Tax=Afifella sp. IM 167 TaxID=2033586 RepID=UPI001CCB405D|nr:thermonuclease family protein [Afifella sp. IM 167]
MIDKASSGFRCTTGIAAFAALFLALSAMPGCGAEMIHGAPSAAATGNAGKILPVCSGANRAARMVTCIVDGDTGWERGVKWRALGVDTPEIGHAACGKERRLGEKARDRLRALMAGGYAIEWAGRRGRHLRELATVRLADGRDAGKVLVEEGLSQPWPNQGNPWCPAR